MMGSSYLLCTLASLQNASKGPLKLTAESEDSIDAEQTKDRSNGRAENSLPPKP